MAKKILTDVEFKDFEIILYNNEGKAVTVIQVETVEELAKELATLMWANPTMKCTPTVWYNGARWPEA